MFKKIFVIFILSFTFLIATDYKISYKGIKMGIIKDISTIKQHYLFAKPDNFLVRWILGKKYLIFHDEEYKEPRRDDTKYKEDKHKIFFMINYVMDGKMKSDNDKIIINEQKYIIIHKKSDIKYTYDYYSHDKFRATGEVIIKDGVLIYFKNKTKNIVIKQI